MRKPALTYLIRRGNVYWFRMAVPLDLVERIGRREIKVSLRTSSLAVARPRCQRLGSAMLQLIARVRVMPELSQKTIQDLARRYFEQQLSSTEELAYLIPSDPAIDRAFEAQDSMDEAERLRTSLAVSEHSSTPERGVVSESGPRPWAPRFWPAVSCRVCFLPTSLTGLWERLHSTSAL